MNFSVNSPILFVLAGVIILAVLLQSVFFLVRAVRRSKEIGMDQQKLRKTMVTAGVFTIAPAVAIVISVITLSKDLGLPLPWLRLSVVGSLSYETIAATNAESAMGLTFGQVSALTASQYVTIAWVMTISIMLGIWLVPLIGKKLQGGTVVVHEGKVIAELPLPVAGLMSDAPLEEVNDLLEQAKAAAHRMGVSPGIDPFMTLSFMSLPVIPALKITTHGVFDVEQWKYI